MVTGIWLLFVGLFMALVSGTLKRWPRLFQQIYKAPWNENGDVQKTNIVILSIALVGGLMALAGFLTIVISVLIRLMG